MASTCLLQSSDFENWIFRHTLSRNRKRKKYIHALAFSWFTSTRSSHPNTDYGSLWPAAVGRPGVFYVHPLERAQFRLDIPVLYMTRSCFSLDIIHHILRKCISKWRAHHQHVCLARIQTQISQKGNQQYRMKKKKLFKDKARGDWWNMIKTGECV